MLEVKPTGQRGSGSGRSGTDLEKIYVFSISIMKTDGAVVNGYY